MQTRIDCTVVTCNIHEPSDSTLLWDAVRVITRILTQPRDETGLSFSFSDYTPKAKRTMLAIRNAKNMETRKSLYPELLKITQKVVGYAGNVIPLLQKTTLSHLVALRDDLKRIVSLTHRVMDQTARRVLHGEEVPAEEKVVSLFEGCVLYQQARPYNGSDVPQ